MNSQNEIIPNGAVGIKDGKIVEDVSIEDKKKYFIKSRGLPQDYDTSKLPDTILNQGKLTFTAYDIDWDLILTKLKRGIDFIEGKVLEINTDEKTIRVQEEDEEEFFNYKEVISTVPLFSLMCLCNSSEDCKQLENTSGDISYGVSDYNPYKDCKYDYLYVVGDKEYYRVTVQEDGKVVYER